MITLSRIAALLAASTLLAAPAFAQAPEAAAGPSTSAMVNLVRALVAKGTLSAAEGEALLGQAQAEAAKAQGSAAPPGTVRVPYVPESVRAQIRDELKEDVLQTAKAEGWAQPGRVQDWVGKIKLYGDFRYRSEFQFYGRGNDPQVFDFAAINANGPTELNGTVKAFAPPLLNTTRDRANRENIRVRFGLTADISDAVRLNIRLASGDNTSPVSTNATLGGGFAKKNIYIDRASVELKPLDDLQLTGGRMANPFTDTMTTVYDDLLWDPDVNLDGIVANLGSGDRFGDALTVHVLGGAFPLEFGSLTFQSSNVNGKSRSINKWLYAAQLVGNYQLRHDIGIKASAAYYHFDNVQGIPSDPCQISITGTECSSDPYRPAFLQKGNTLFALRNIITTPDDRSLRQFVGLTFGYRLLDLKTDVTVRLDEHKQVTVGADYVKNLAFKRSNICKAFPGGDANLGAFRGPINNLLDSAPECKAAGDNSGFQGGDTAWQVKAQVGWPAISHFGEWNVIGAYKYIESDSMLDSLTDSDFHLGGTNAKGYFIAGTMGLFDGVAGRARYSSSNQISGAPLAIDVLQLDLLVSF